MSGSISSSKNPASSKNSASKSKLGGLRSSGGRTLKTTLRSTARAIKKNYWLWPLLAALAIGLGGWQLEQYLAGLAQSAVASQLTTTVNVQVESLSLWANNQKSINNSLASDTELVKIAQELLAESERIGGDRIQLLQSAAGKQFVKKGSEYCDHQGYIAFQLISPKRLVIAGTPEELVGKERTGFVTEFLQKALLGETTVSRPFPSQAAVEDIAGVIRTGVPTMLTVGPVKDEAGKVIAILALQQRPERDFTRILQLARPGKTGECYAFDRNGIFLSNSRFDDQLIKAGLLPDVTGSQSMLTLQMRNPGVDMMLGGRPEKRRQDQPITALLAKAQKVIEAYEKELETGGERPALEDVLVNSYLDYRGVPQAGAFRWLPEWGLGIAAEVDYAEAFELLGVFRTILYGVMALLGMSTMGLLLAAQYMDRYRREALAAAIEGKQIGQYTLEEKIGEGGMGSVYRGRHALMRRPTAIKLLGAERTTDAAISRFEREVQQTCVLNHPNTISIFDFGRTPEGVFFYAMEFLDGMDLEKLVQRYGPQPAGRVIHLLRQICGSLTEAHELGLVHRDIKPANIIISRRGGVSDFVKVMDFGLVKAVDGAKAANLTSANALTGTPLYMPPEAIQSPEKVEARSDLYAVGGVGYYLVTGQTLFSGDNVMDICMKQVNELPPKPSERLGKTVPEDLEALIMSCLAKSLDDRPMSARNMLSQLERLADARSWTAEQADVWWDDFAAGRAPTMAGPVSGRSTSQSTAMQTLIVPSR